MNTEPMYEDLAKAIVIRAAEDYKKYRFLLETLYLRRYRNEEKQRMIIGSAQKEVKEVEIFFGSKWFEELSGGLDGTKAFIGLKETYEREYYPMRISELLGDIV